MTTRTVDRKPVVPEWTLGDRMAKALNYSGVGVQEMADYLDVTRTSVSNWLHGRVRPSRQTLLLWAIRTGVDLDWIVQGGSTTESFSIHRAKRAIAHHLRARRSTPHHGVPRSAVLLAA
jgi:transcriptional regulator with XRE-family HTH domain